MRELSRITGFAQDRLLSRIRSSPPKDFVPLATFGRTKFAQIREKLNAIHGHQHRHRQPAGRAEVARADRRAGKRDHPGGGAAARRPAAGRRLGRAGRPAAGLPGPAHRLDRDQGGHPRRSDRQQVEELKAWRPVRKATPVQTTIDSRVQSAADAAVAGVPSSALVAVKASTGEILAVVHQRPAPGEGRPRRESTRPGTAFSIIAADAACSRGASIRRRRCPAPRSARWAARGSSSRASRAALAHVPDRLRQRLRHRPGLARPAGQRAVAEPPPRRSSASARTGGSRSRRSAARSPTRPPTPPWPESSPGRPSGEPAGDGARGRGGRHRNLAAAGAGDLARCPGRRPRSSSGTLPTAPQEGRLQPITLDATTMVKLRALMRAGVTSGAARAAAAPGEEVYGVAAQAVQVEKKQRLNLSWFVGWQGDVAVAVLAQNANAGGAGDRRKLLQKAWRRRARKFSAGEQPSGASRASYWVTGHRLGGCGLSRRDETRAPSRGEPCRPDRLDPAGRPPGRVRRRRVPGASPHRAAAVRGVRRRGRSPGGESGLRVTDVGRARMASRGTDWARSGETRRGDGLTTQ